MSGRLRLGLSPSIAGVLPTSGGAASIAISGTPVTTATKDSAYTGFTVSSTGGSAAGKVFSVASGTLPAGITLDAATGEVAGTPTAEGTQAGIVIRVTDIVGASADLAPFQIAVSAGGGYPVWLPQAPSGDYPLAFFDKDNHFWSGAAVVTAADVLDAAGVAAYSNGTGLVLVQNASLVSLIGDALTAALTAATGFTVVIGCTAAGPSTVLFTVSNADDTEEVFTANLNSTTNCTFNDYSTGSDNRSFQTGGAAGANKFAASRSQAELIASANGAATVADTTPWVDTPSGITVAIFGGYAGGTIFANGTVTSLAIYAPQPNADLPTLST